MHIYTRKDIISAFRRLGIEHGDILFLSTSLGMLGSAQGVSTGDGLNDLFHKAIRDVLGRDGTILVPTYSYTFGKDHRRGCNVFDPKNTPADTGPFPEYFRKLPGARRSLDPMVSISGIGPACDELMDDLPATSYGADCIFDRLIYTKAKCCNVGLGPNWTPFLHHADWLVKVPFRYDKVFFGTILVNGIPKEMKWVYSVRDLSDASRADAHKLANMSEDAGIWKRASLGRGRIYAASYKQYFDFTVASQKADPWLTAAGPAPDLI